MSCFFLFQYVLVYRFIKTGSPLLNTRVLIKPNFLVHFLIGQKLGIAQQQIPDTRLSLRLDHRP